MHNVEYAVYEENVKRDYVQSYWDAVVRREDYQEGASGLPNPIRWITTTIYETEAAARAAIERADKGAWYNQMAVKFKDYPPAKPSKKLGELSAKINEQRANLQKIIDQSGIQHRTSEYIGCEKCGSKLKRVLLKGNKCPLCGEDLRSKTNLDRIAAATERLDKLKKQYAEAYEAEQRKQKPTVKWLVKVEYHT